MTKKEMREVDLTEADDAEIVIAAFSLSLRTARCRGEIASEVGERVIAEALTWLEKFTQEGESIIPSCEEYLRAQAQATQGTTEETS